MLCRVIIITIEEAYANQFFPSLFGSVGPLIVNFVGTHPSDDHHKSIGNPGNRSILDRLAAGEEGAAADFNFFLRPMTFRLNLPSSKPCRTIFTSSEFLTFGHGCRNPPNEWRCRFNGTAVAKRTTWRPEDRRWQGRTAQNAKSRGLTLSCPEDPSWSTKIKALSRLVVGEPSDDRLIALACHVVAAQIDFIRVRKARRELISGWINEGSGGSIVNDLARVEHYERRVLSRPKMVVRYFCEARVGTNRQAIQCLCLRLETTLRGFPSTTARRLQAAEFCALPTRPFRCPSDAAPDDEGGIAGL